MNSKTDISDRGAATPSVEPENPDASQRLRSHLQSLGIGSFRTLAQQAGVSEWQVRQLRRGKAGQMRLESLQKLSQVLQLQLESLVAIADPSHQEPPPRTSTLTPSPAAIQQEYERLQQQLAQQRQTLLLEFQRSSLYTLEAWMKNWPKVVQVVKTQNPELPAAKVLALVTPVSQLLASWGVENVGEMGEAIAYDPTCHSLAGAAQPGDLVTVTRPGYRHGGALLHRAEVKLV